MKCCGCSACADICPRKCIEMVSDACGFLFPKIDHDQCINCGACERVCPINFKIEENLKNETAFACVSNDKDVLFNSSSGGAFSSIYNYFIRKGYCVYGVKWGDNLQVRYDCAKTVAGCEEFRKSKYVAADTNHCFTSIEKQLRSGEKVLFSGTPCHCAALKSYLEIKKIPLDNIFIVDIICHGAPGQKIFDSYIDESNKRSRRGNISSFSFKNKKPYFGSVNTRSAEITYDDGSSVIVDEKSDAFLKGYYSRLFYRDSCLECRFASENRITDMTIGDAWHIEEKYPEWDSHGGVSLVILNSERAKAVCSDIFADMDIKDVTMEWAIAHNSQLHEPAKVHPKRELFFDTYVKEGYYAAIKKAIKPSAVGSVKRIVKRLIK